LINYILNISTAVTYKAEGFLLGSNVKFLRQIFHEAKSLGNFSKSTNLVPSLKKMQSVPCSHASDFKLSWARGGRPEVASPLAPYDSFKFRVHPRNLSFNVPL
jgi:hypothetical protein